MQCTSSTPIWKHKEIHQRALKGTIWEIQEDMTVTDTLGSNFEVAKQTQPKFIYFFVPITGDLGGKNMGKCWEGVCVYLLILFPHPVLLCSLQHSYISY